MLFSVFASFLVTFIPALALPDGAGHACLHFLYLAASNNKMALMQNTADGGNKLRSGLLSLTAFFFLVQLARFRNFQAPNFLAVADASSIIIPAFTFYTDYLMESALMYL